MELGDVFFKHMRAVAKGLMISAVAASLVAGGLEKAGQALINTARPAGHATMGLANAWDSGLPPAIANSLDEGVKRAYAFFLNGRYEDARIILTGGRISGMHIQMQSFYEDPAAMIAIMTYNTTVRAHLRINLLTDAAWLEGKMKNQYPAQYYFMEGFGGFLSKHKLGSVKTRNSTIEENLLKTIFYAAYPENNLAMQKYAAYMRTTTLAEKKQFVDEILKRAEQLDFVHQRWIAYSNKYLVDHYANTQQDELGKIFYRNLEKPLIKENKLLLVRPVH